MNRPADDDLRRMIGDLARRLERVESALGIDQISGDALARVKALIKNGSNAFFNGVRENPHPPGSREHELWAYGFDLGRDVSEGR
jgi:hypothetical protein